MKFTQKSSIIVYIDHFVSIIIVKQYSLITTDANKLNLRLVHASQYLSTFDLNVRHKLEKQNLISDALSRLLRERESLTVNKNAEKILDALHTNFIVTSFANRTNYILSAFLIKMSSEFRTRLISAIKTNKKEKDVIVIANRKSLITDEIKRERDIIKDLKEKIFVLQNELLYHYQEFDSRLRLIISKILKTIIFDLAHDSHYTSFRRTYQHVIELLYIRKLFDRLKKFIDHCSQCQLLQTRRHKFYEDMQLIRTLSLSFHTLTINFVMTLLLSVRLVKNEL